MSTQSTHPDPEEVVGQSEVAREESGEENDSESGPEHDEGGVEAEAGPSAAGGTSSGKKKKKKKSKAAKLFKALTHSNELPQALVDHVMDAVRKEHGDTPEASEENVRSALEQLKVMDVVKGKAGIGGKGKKDMGEHKFWGTQPVPQPGEGPPIEDGYIEHPVPREQVRQEPYPLPKDFEWSIIDLTDPTQTKEVYELLSANYVEDDYASFRFQYTSEFLAWALKPPGYEKTWHIGVRVKSNKKLVGFISGVPMSLRVRGHVIRMSEINFLCVHKKLRSKRLAPVLIKEVTRQVHLTGVFQAIYTAGTVLPGVVSTCRYYHRLLNVPKLVDIKFTFVPRNMTLARLSRINKLPEKPTLLGKGLREMTERDVPEVLKLFERYMQRFTMQPLMTLAEAKHHFLSGLGEGDRPNGSPWKGRREGQVVWSFVVENPDTHKITDFFSFYSLPSTVMQSTKYPLLEAAYLFYYATDVALQSGVDDAQVNSRLEEVVGDALIVADQAQFDVFNALTLMDNVNFLEHLKFGAGDGYLNFYLYNWRTASLAGVREEGGVKAGKGVGVVML